MVLFSSAGLIKTLFSSPIGEATLWLGGRPKQETRTMEYEYRAVDANGEAVAGHLEAASPADVVRALARDGRVAMQVSERKPVRQSAWQRRLRNADVVVALRELATLLGSGVALADAVVAQSRGSRHPRLAAAFSQMGEALMRGASFGEAARESALPLPDYVHQLIAAGERSGELPRSLQEAVAQLDYDERVAADLRGALTYPALLIASGIAAVLIVFVVVVPNFADLLRDGENLPWLASAVLGAGVWFNANTGLFGALLVGAALGLAAAWRSPKARRAAANGAAQLPVVGAWLTETDTAKWASLMAAMLSARVELLDALGLAHRGMRISRRQTRLERAATDVRAGMALSAAMEKHRALTPAGYNLIRVGEQSGQLAAMLRALATLYNENSARRMKRVLALIEPLAIVVIGGVLGTIMIGIILALTSVNELADPGAVGSV